MDKINIAIIGLGNIGTAHAKKIFNGKVPNAHLAAICDISQQRRDYAKKHFNGVAIFENAEDLFASTLIDSVIISVPHYDHPPLAIKAFEYGLNVLVEKPAGVYTKHVIEMNEAAKKSGTWNRTPQYYTESDWKGTFAKEGGSLLSNQSIHLIDMLAFLFKGIKSVQAELSVTKLRDIIETEDTASILLRFGNGASGCIFATNTYSYDEPYRIEVRFEKGIVSYTNGYLFAVTDSNPAVIASDRNNSTGKSYWGAGHTSVTEQFYTFLENGHGSYLSIDYGINSLEDIFEIYKHSKIYRPNEIIL